MKAIFSSFFDTNNQILLKIISRYIYFAENIVSVSPNTGWDLNCMNSSLCHSSACALSKWCLSYFSRSQGVKRFCLFLLFKKWQSRTRDEYYVGCMSCYYSNEALGDGVVRTRA